MTHKKVIGRLMVAAAGAAVSLGFLASPASAHASHQDICAGAVCYGTVDVNGTHNVVTVCDTKADGVAVGVQATTTASPTTIATFLRSTTTPGCSTFSSFPAINKYRGFTNTGIFMPWVVA